MSFVTMQLLQMLLETFEDHGKRLASSRVDQAVHLQLSRTKTLQLQAQFLWKNDTLLAQVLAMERFLILLKILWMRTGS